MRRNPFAPEVPCHRIICADGVSTLLPKFKELKTVTDSGQAIGGFKGEPQDAPSGINQKMKRDLLSGEGVLFDEKGNLIEEERWWDDFRP